MIIQLWHSRDSNYLNDLYDPIKNSSFFIDHSWIFPHDGNIHVDSRESLKSVDLFIVDVTNPATGLGIEIGFASVYNTDIIYIYKQWSNISSSLRYITDMYIEYTSTEDLIEQLGSYLTR